MVARASTSAVSADPSRSDEAWRAYLGRLLNSGEVRARLGLTSIRRVNALARRHQLLGLPTAAGETMFPEFQFRRDGGPHARLPEILATLAPAVETPYTIACWFVTPQPELNAQTPARWLELGYAPERVVEAAQHSAARLAQ